MAIAYLISIGLIYEDAFSRTFINPRPGQIARLKELGLYFKGQPLPVSLEKKQS